MKILSAEGVAVALLVTLGLGRVLALSLTWILFLAEVMGDFLERMRRKRR